MSRKKKINPVTFTCRATLSVPRSEIFRNFTSLNAWNSFDGYGPLPGIQKAVYEVETDKIVGTVIRAYNTDGSSHKEKITSWSPPDSFEVKLYNFPTPLSYLSGHFNEHWKFEVHDNTEIVFRSMDLYPNNVFTKPLVWVISRILQKAISCHLEKITSERDSQH